jgi:glycosyltransferase involved in cell wall biosynthesis
MKILAMVTTKNLPCEMAKLIPWGEEHNIANYLESIKNQNYLSRRSKTTLWDPQDKIELIVVDNNSVDRTQDGYKSTY